MSDSTGKPQFTVCIEGNIGCGKTTLLNYFAQFPDVGIFHEPIHKWTDLKNHNLLDLMYKDPSTWSHLFQTYVQLTMLEQHIMPCQQNTKIMERSLYSARYCFVENLYRTGKMSEIEYLVYCEWFKMLSTVLHCKVDLIVYLRTDPTILHERIRARNRSEVETSLPLEYLQSLHDIHEEWIYSRATQESTPVLVMDANGSLQEMQELYVKHMKEIAYGHSSPLAQKFKTSPLPKSAAVSN